MNSVDLLCVASFDGTFKKVNPSWSRVLGWSEEELVGKTWLDLVHPDDHEITVAAGEKLFEGELICNFENRYQCKNGEYKWLVWNSFPSMDEREILAVARDATLSKESEEKNLSQQKIITSLLEKSPMSILIYNLENDSDLILTSYNNAARNDLHINAAEIIGKELRDIFPTLSNSRIPEEFCKLAKDGGSYADTSFTYKDSRINGAFDFIAFQTIPNQVAVIFKDITEQHLKDEQIKHKASFLRSVLLAVPTGIVVMENDRIIQVNTSVCDMLEMTEDELLKINFSSLFYDMEAGQNIIKKMARNIGNGTSISRVETTIKGSNDKSVEVAIRGTRLDSEKHKEMWIYSLADISNRKKSEIAIKQSEERFRNLVETTNDWIWELDADSCFTYVSPRCRSLLGYEPEELIGKSAFDLMQPEEARKVNEEYSQYVDKAVAFNSMPNINIRKDGKKVAIESSGVPYYDENGRFLGYRGADRDVTDRYKAELQLRNREQHLRVILNSLAEAVIVTDETGKITRINPAAEKLFQIDSENVLGEFVTDYLKLSTSEFSDLSDQIRNVALKGENINLKGYNVLNINNEVLNVTCYGVPLKSVDDKITGALFAIQDITENVKAQEQLRQSQKMESIGQLAGGIAHDFNNMLGGILGFADLVMMQVNEPKLKKYASSIAETAERAADLTAKLLAFSRKGKFINQTTDIHEVINSALILLAHSIDRRINIEKHFEADTVMVVGDPGLLQSMILNLGVNARDAMPEGGRFSVYTENVFITDNDCEAYIPAIQPGLYVKITLTDTGIGIPDCIHKQVFEPFFTTKEVGEGTGLGLAAVYGTVQDHAGFIDFESKLDEGTSFSVLLPVVEVMHHKVEKIHHAAFKGSGLVLVVDDEEIIRNLVCEELAEFGFEGVTAANGKEAIDIYKMNHDHIVFVILDLVMPEMTGQDTLVELRNIDPEVKIILSSGYSQSRDADIILEDDRTLFIQKPHRMGDFRAAVEKISNC